MKTIRIGLAALCLSAGQAAAQDFYDPSVLRTVDLQFHDANWWQLLQQNYVSQTNILADMTVDGQVYPGVGVRIRGNTSYTALPSGSQKVSLNIETDEVDPEQEVLGYKNFNFNNAFTDPTFCREVVYSNLLADWIPNGRANNIVLRLNGADWGVYANVQQFDKRMLRNYFEDDDGMRVKCANNPNGPGLQYAGTSPGAYAGYEIKDDGGLADPLGALIAVCAAVDNTPPANWPLIDQVFAVDPAIWTVALENLCADDDSYINKGADFVMYRNPVDGRTHLLQTDGNESFKFANWSPTLNFSQNNKPVLSNMLAAPELRQRYFAHMRSLLPLLDWAVIGPIFTAQRDLIDAAVQADPKKLYSYAAFQTNFTSTVNVGGFPPFGGNIIGLKQYVDQRRALLLSNAELNAPAPVIGAVTASTDAPSVPVHISAPVSGPLVPVASVWLHFQPDISAPWTRVAMADDGLSGDGLAGDGVYGALLPLTGVAGQRVPYYVRAVSANAFQSTTFEPKRTEIAPHVLEFAIPYTDIVINEVLAQNTAVLQDENGQWEDYVELYNRGTSTIDLGGLYMTDKLSDPTAWQIPAGTLLAPGATLLFWADEDLDQGPLHADFKLSAGGENVAIFGRDGTTLIASLPFGAQQPNISVGPLFDGDSELFALLDPTPGASNQPACGTVRYDATNLATNPLNLAATGSTSLGGTLTFQLEGADAAAPCWFAWGPGETAVAIPQGVLLVVPVNVLGAFATDGAGAFALPVGLPPDPVFAGLRLHMQGAAIAAGTTALTNGIELILCP